MIGVATTGPSAYWYLTRGTGTVALILLTLSVALGVANSRRLRTERVPRFVVDAVHRNVSLLAVAFTVVHIVTSLLDGFAPITVVDGVVPFVSVYRPLWLGLGAVAFDLLLAVVITSLLRRRLGYRAWRATHWAAYASWPVALLHTLGTGSDVKFGWMLAICLLCLSAVLAAVLVRATAGWPGRMGARLAALLGCAALPLGLIVWLPSGPLTKGWARRAGTPSYLASGSTRASRGTGSAGGSESNASTDAPPSFTGQASGIMRERQASDGQTVVDLALTIAGQRLNRLEVRIVGQPLQGGGVQMTDNRVTLGSSANPAEYSGRVTALQGTEVTAQLQASSGSVLSLLAQLRLDPGGGAVSGTVRVAPASG